MKKRIRNIMSTLGRWFNSPWYKISESRRKLIDEQRLTIEEKSRSIAELIDLLHATEDSLAVQREVNDGLREEIAELEYELTLEYKA